ncbi:MAG TPA: DUF5666 domain-containing protein, partial [Streptosporangiaceae bacterium]
PRVPFMPLPGLLPGPLNEVLYGETVAKADDGSIKAFDWQNGQVTGVSGSSVTVRSSDGTTWTWTLTGDTLVRKNKKDGSASDIAAGDKVAIAGARSGGTRTAARVMDPAPDLSKLRQRLPDLRDRLPRLHEGPRPGLQLRPPA